MSTRWYPLYQKGNPQLRVFLPNFWLKLLPQEKKEFKQPPNLVKFQCSMGMTTFDVKNYLEKIYNINVVDVKLQILMGRFKKDRLQGSIIKEDDFKVAYVLLPKDQSFVFPDLFKDAKSTIDEEALTESRKDLDQFLESNKAPGLPGWFRI